MNELIKIKNLAILYFEGEISFADEKVLFAYVKQDTANLALFKEWEKQWIFSNEKVTNVEEEWQRLHRKIAFRGVEKSVFKLQQHGSWKNIVLAAVAAAVIFIVGGSFFINKYVLSETDEHQYVTIEAPKGQKTKVTLRDGSVVWLNSASKISYADTHNPSELKVKLEGEGYFEVSKNKNRKFIVETAFYNIEVRGTKFNVTTYDDKEFATTTLIEGKIDVLHRNEKIEVAPGEQVKYELRTGKITKSTVDASASSAWIKNRILYENILLQELAIKLSQKYEVNILLETPEFGLKPITISLRNEESIDEVMRAIEKIIPVKVERKGVNYYIKERKR